MTGHNYHSSCIVFYYSGYKKYYKTRDISLYASAVVAGNLYNIHCHKIMLYHVCDFIKIYVV